MGGSPRNFRRLVAAQKALWRSDHHRGRRPAVWAPGEYLVIDWGAERRAVRVLRGAGVSRVRFVRFAADERAATTLALLAECSRAGAGQGPGRPDGLPKGAVVVPTAEYLRFAAH